MIKERKKLLESQRQLIILKNQLIRDAENLVEKRKNEYQRTLNMIAEELGINIKWERWQLDDKIEYFTFLKQIRFETVIPTREEEKSKMTIN